MRRATWRVFQMNGLTKIWLLAPLAILGAACSKSTPTDDALKNDLALASQAQQFMPPQVTSPTEQGLAANPYTTPVRRAAASSAPRATTVRRTSTASTARSSAPAVYYPAPAPTVEKHTKRDAAIGAAA